MTLVASWKTAKKLFETTTGKKKPSSTFLGLFKESSGIEPALKDADGAKTTADLSKAIAKFQTTSAAYVKLLTQSISDPKSVPTSDKSTYVAAVKRLQQDIAAIEQEAADMATVLGGAASKKDHVDPAKLKAYDEHLKLRLRAVVEAEKLVKAFSDALAKGEDHLDKAVQQREQAAKAGKSGDILGHQVAVGVIQRHLDEVKKIAKQIREVYDSQVADGDSLIMEARGDPSTTGIPDAVQKVYEPKSKEAFRKMAASTAKLNALKSGIDSKVDELKAVRAQAEAMGNRVKSVEEHQSRLAKIAKGVEDGLNSLKIMGDRVIKGEADVAGIRSQEAATQLKWYGLQEGQWERYGPEVKVARKRFAALLDQAAALPRDALESPAVVRQAKEIRVAVKEAMDYCDTVDLAGSSLLAKIKLQRSRLPA